MFLEPPEPPFPRWTRDPFPAYRHRPGLTPHPRSDPRGHSYSPGGEPPIATQEPVPEKWRSLHDYLLGVDLYNHGYWWEAHEAWERLWRASSGSVVAAEYFQGLIKASAAQLKLAVGEPEGARRHAAQAVDHLDRVASHQGKSPFMGLDVAAFVESLRRHITSRGEFPFLELERAG